MIFTFRIADTNINIDSDLTHEISVEFKPFIQQCNETADYTAVIRNTAALAIADVDPIASDYDHEVYTFDNGSFERYFHLSLSSNNEIYAISHSKDLKETRICYLDSKKDYLKNIHQAFRMSGWEGAMARNHRLLLHASLIETEYGGILFAGPSGMGKSTQASLWENYRNAHLINGDRPILRKKEEQWLAYGSPLAGSSRVCLNENTRVRAIVVLSQDSECRIERLPAADAFRALYGLSTVYYWSQEYVENVLEMIQELVIDIPVYHMACTPDEQAVLTLEDRLRGDALHGTV